MHPRVNYLNLITGLWPRLVEQVADVTYFGPGRTPWTQLEQGVSRFIESMSVPPEVVVVSELVTNPEGEGGDNKRARELSRIYGYSSWEAREFLKQKGRWIDEIRRLGLTTLLTFFEFDPYRVKSAWIHRVDHWDDAYLMGLGPEFLHPIASLPNLHKESFAGRANDSWREMLLRHASRLFSQPTFVGDSEFCDRTLTQRRTNWAILGVEYSARREARRFLQRHGERVSGSMLGLSVKAYDRATNGRIGNRIFIRIAQYGFRQTLAKSRASYTCGSGLDYPVRKMLEVPASGALLVMPHSESARHMGLIPGTHYVAAAPADVPMVSPLLSDPDESGVQTIATAGQRLVRAKHTVSARSPEFRAALLAMMEGSFAGSSWRDGAQMFAGAGPSPNGSGS